MKDVIRFDNQFYILANSSLVEQQTSVLKSGDTFAVFNAQGSIRPLGFENHGIYFGGTRFLSRLVMNIEGNNPLLLSSAIKEDNDLYAVDLTNPDFISNNILIKRGILHFCRSIFLYQDCCYERVRITNYGLESVRFSFTLEFEADFCDIFEARGLKRKKRGDLRVPIIDGDSITLVYDGLDRIRRTTRLDFSPEPSALENAQARFSVELQPQEQKDFFITVVCQSQSRKAAPPTYDEAAAFLSERSELRRKRCRVETSNHEFNNWLNRSSADLFMMLTETPDGLYPYAGIPWYSTIFGRDGIITALETLWIYPDISRGVLMYLAAHQAKAVDPSRDAEPGKIVHEERSGEMANLNEIPFGRYYGSVDATLLFLILAGHYFERTNDLGLIEKIWPSIELALEWIGKYGDIDGDGFVEYERKSANGLSHQGWKDSEDAIFHQNGEMAQPPIALCEVQGYLYEAKIQISKLAQFLDKSGLSRRLLVEAKDLRRKFHEKFWCEDIGMYALALDGKKQPCRVLSSNAGQCLFSGIIPQKQARQMAKLLTSETFFSGWGIRTISSTQSRYNPMSYHNGSVWPHDNALIAFGLSRYGFKEAAIQVLTGLFDASLFCGLSRLPELFCGFMRRPSEGPIPYPVACNPQSWSSAAPFMFLQACLGLKIDGLNQKIYFVDPVLPDFLEVITIYNLRVGSAKVDLVLKRHGDEVGVNVSRQEGKVEVVFSKTVR